MTSKKNRRGNPIFLEGQLWQYLFCTQRDGKEWTGDKRKQLFEQNVRQELELLKRYEQNLSRVPGRQDHVCYYLTVTFGIENYEGYLRWCKKAKGMLR